MDLETARSSVDLGHLFVAAISDSLDAIGLRNQVVASRVRPIAPDVRLFGRAITAMARPVSVAPDSPYERLLFAIDSASPGDVLVMDVGGRNNSGIFGGLLATACQSRGMKGAAVDGAVRDSADLLRQQFPTFASGVCAADSLGRDEVVTVNTPISFGGVEVNPGDYIVGDGDGLVVVPAHCADAVVAAAVEKAESESEVRIALADGMPLADAFKRFGIL